MRGQHRRRTFKTPPIAEKEASQHVRREKALEEQKRKRAQRLESLRNIDAFAGLSLGPEDEDLEDETEVLPEGVSRLASLLPVQNHEIANKQPYRKERKPNARFANKIMYAELLEMKDDPLFDDASDADGGLPYDLETNWVALAPIPQGKRCLAVSNQSINRPGTVSNTFLKSRLKGRTILTFPSPLPPSTILDCILDENWKSNGILHVLDVIQWKGQEIGECETNFRFWWRDTRLSELVPLPPSFCATHSDNVSAAHTTTAQQIFSYPTLLLPVPYCSDLSYSSLLSTVIPLARSTRPIEILLPPELGSSFEEQGMDIDHRSPVRGVAEVHSDGLLLYVSQASYEPGTSPLSSWVPGRSLTEGRESPLTIFERLVSRRAAIKDKVLRGQHDAAMEH